jgi:hypothetical protein
VHDLWKVKRSVHKKLKFTPLIIFFGVILAMGCQYDPYTSVYTSQKPKPKDLIGIYHPDPNSMTVIAKEGHYPPVVPTITLLNDSTIVITNIPDWWLTSFGNPQGGFDSGKGTWEIQKHQNWWAVLVSFPDTTQFASRKNAPGGLTTEMMLVGNNPPHKLHLTVGDPDGGRAMQFQRASNP